MSMSESVIVELESHVGALPYTDVAYFQHRWMS